MLSKTISADNLSKQYEKTPPLRMIHISGSMRLPLLLFCVLFSTMLRGEGLYAHSPVTPLVTVHTIKRFGANMYLLETASDLYLVDAGYPGGEGKVLNAIMRLGGKKLRLIFITHGHFDHYGSAAALRRITGAPIGIHRLDAKAMSEGKTPIDSVKGFGRVGKLLLPVAETVFRVQLIKPDIRFEDNDSLHSFGLDARIVRTPGHTEGSVSLIVQDTIAFTGDLLVTSLGLGKQRYYARSWGEIDSSLVLIKQLAPKHLYSGHHHGELSLQQLLEIN